MSKVNAQTNIKETSRYKMIKKYIPDISEWVRAGVTRRDISKRLGIEYSTFIRWVRSYPEFNAALELGDDLALDDIEASLFLSCKPQQLEEIWYDGEGALTKKFVKTIPPNQRAIEYHLNNRRPDKWRADTTSIDISLSEQMREKFKSMDIQDIVALANIDVDSAISENEQERDTE